MKLPEELKRFRFDGDSSQTAVTMRGVIDEVSEAVARHCAKVCDHGVKWEPELPKQMMTISKETAHILHNAILREFGLEP